MPQTIRGFSIAIFILLFLLPKAGSAQSPGGQSTTAPSREHVQEILGLKPQKSIAEQGPANIAGVSEAVAKAIVWNNYWFGYWPTKIPKMIQANATLTAWSVRAEKGQAVYVFVDELHSVFHCYRDGEPYVQSVWDHEDALLPAGPQLEEYDLEKRQYGVGQQSFSIRLNPALSQTLAFGEFDALKIERVQRVFEEYVLNKDFFDNVREYRSPKLAGRPIRVHVGNFNLNSTWIYYYVEGMDYLETIEFDPAGKRFVYLDAYSFTAPPHAVDYPHAIKRIQEDGTWFVVKDGKLVKE